MSAAQTPTRSAVVSDPARTFDATLLTAVFDRLAVGVGVCDEDGHFIAVNTRLARLLGRTRSEIIGRPFLAFVPVQERAACLAGYFDAVVATANAQRSGDGRRTLRWLTGNGAAVPLAAHWTVSDRGPSGPRRSILHLHDIAAVA